MVVREKKAQGQIQRRVTMLLSHSRPYRRVTRLAPLPVPPHPQQPGAERSILHVALAILAPRQIVLGLFTQRGEPSTDLRGAHYCGPTLPPALPTSKTRVGRLASDVIQKQPLHWKTTLGAVREKHAHSVFSTARAEILVWLAALGCVGELSLMLLLPPITLICLSQNYWLLGLLGFFLNFLTKNKHNVLIIRKHILESVLIH